jgi:hypothetical protein
MSAPALLETLRARGVEVAVNGNRLHIEAPAGVLTPKVLETIRAHKADILKVLRTENASEELPPALIERPGLTFCNDGLWRWRGFIVPTRGTRPVLQKYFEKREASRRLAA